MVQVGLSINDELLAILDLISSEKFLNRSACVCQLVLEKAGEMGRKSEKFRQKLAKVREKFGVEDDDQIEGTDSIGAQGSEQDKGNSSESSR